MHIVLGAALAVAQLGPAAAQSDDGAGNPGIEEGMDLLQEGTRLLLEGLMQEIGPALMELRGKIIDLNAYHAPEILPNGDIIIRRKVPLAPGELPPAAEGEIDL